MAGPELGGSTVYKVCTHKNKGVETLAMPRPHNPKGLTITMIPRPRPQEDIDVLRSATTRTKRTHYRRRTVQGKVQPLGLNQETRQETYREILRQNPIVWAFVFLLCLAVGLATGGVSAVNDADVNGPDEMYHRAEGRL